MSISGTALFIEPQGSLLASLRERKAWLESSLPGQVYGNHPPHCTLLFGAYGEPNGWLGLLATAIGRISSFTLTTKDWQQFPNDAMAGGGHTIAYRAEPNPGLFQLQAAAAGTLAPFLEPARTPHPLASIEPFGASLRRYGFPFVGPHWIPHFTIGSPRVASGDPLLAKLMSGPTRHQFPVLAVSVWRVQGNHHERLHEVALAPRKT